MLELPNFSHVTKSTITFESCDTILLVIPWSECMMVITFTSSCNDFKKVWSIHFADIIITAITPVSAIFKNTIKVKKNTYSLLTCKFYQDNKAIISGCKKLLVSVEKC